MARLKIISSTDHKLVFNNTFIKEIQGVEMEGTHHKSLPQPSQAFIEAYCEQGGIDEVDVEYEIVNEESTHKFQPGATIINHYLKLKVDPIHNTITTHRIKPMSTFDILTKFTSDFPLHRGVQITNSEIEKWIEENL
jgi:hypothetical protein